eukprot:2964222-Alexandrium_andersonii.AAC.1
MAQGDESVIKNRTSKSSRVLVEIDPRPVRLVGSREDLEFVWTTQGYSKVRCKASDHELPVELHAVHGTGLSV